MAFDGFFYRKHSRQLADLLTGTQIDKIYQVGRYDLFIQLKGGGTQRLLISVHPAQPRILLIDQKPDTPDAPPMFSMLLRKHLQSGRISAVKQLGMERIVDIDIAVKNQIGDLVDYKLRVEIMGKHSNLILLDGDMKIVDAIKRVGENISIRPVLPNIKYSQPPSQKQNLLEIDDAQFSALLRAQKGVVRKALYQYFEGVSPDIATTICLGSATDGNAKCDQLDEAQCAALWQSSREMLSQLDDGNMWLYREGGLIKAFSAVKTASEYEAEAVSDGNYFAALADYYKQKKDSNQIAQRAATAIKRIDGLIVRTVNRIDNLSKDLVAAEELDKYKLYGELITANLHAVKKGMKSIEVVNYYDGKTIVIPLSVDKAPNENAQHYYKRYNKAKTTLVKAKALIGENEADLAYLKQVRSLLECAETSDDINQLIDELVDGGYFKSRARKRQKKSKKLPPLKYQSSEGVIILVGRNNYQNDELTTKKADREHIWLHTKDIAGSHVIITKCFADIAEQTIVEAAMIAAYHSDGRHSSQVPVDFTEVKFVKKPRGAKPGMVIFTDNKTIYVNPQRDAVLAMRVDD